MTMRKHKRGMKHAATTGRCKTLKGKQIQQGILVPFKDHAGRFVAHYHTEKNKVM